jgi:hypothetical protein
MKRIGSRGPLIDQAKNVARQIIERTKSSNRIMIATTNGDGGMSAGFKAPAQAQEIVAEVEASNTAHYTKEQFKQVYQQLQDSPESQAVLYLISDGQASQLQELKDIQLDDGNNRSKAVAVQLINLEQAKQQNVAISSVQLKSQMLNKGAPITLEVQVENVSETAVANQFVSMEVEGELSGQYEMSLEAGAEKEFTFQIVPQSIGDITGRIIIEGDEVDYDNEQYFAIRIPETRSILLITDETEKSSFSSYLKPALRAAQQTNAQLSFEEKGLAEVDQAKWNDYDAIILDGTESVPEYWFEDLRRYVQEGGGVLFFPSEKGEIPNYNKFLGLFNAGRFDNVIGEYGSFNTVVKMAELEEGHPILDELFLKEENNKINVEVPSIFYYYHYNTASNTGTLELLEAANSDPLLSEQQFGSGVLLVSAIGADPGWSNFPVNPLFAPLYYRSVLYISSSESGGLQQHQLGETFTWQAEGEKPEVTLYINGTEYKPEVERSAEGIKIEYEGRNWQPGILSVKTGNKEHKIAVNQNIMESRSGTLTNEQWQTMFDENVQVNTMLSSGDLSTDRLEKKLNNAVFGKEIWNWFIWAALLFLLIETVMTRLYKAETIS